MALGVHCGVMAQSEISDELYRRAESGDAQAQYDLGYALYQANRDDEVLPWIRKAADQDNPDALFFLSLCYEEGILVPVDMEKGALYNKMAAERGHVAAMNNLAVSYKKGVGVPQSYEKALEWYRKAADGGHLIAMRNLGDCYRSGYGTPIDLTKATEWYRKAASKGDGPSKYWLWELYKYDNVPIPEEEALIMLKEAEQSGIPEASLELALFCKDNGYYPEYRKMLLKAAQRGNHFAIFLMGQGYYNGDAITVGSQEPNYELAVKYLEPLAEKIEVSNLIDYNRVLTLYTLSKCYRHGRGVEQDLKKADEYFRKAAAISGDPDKLELYEFNATFEDN